MTDGREVNKMVLYFYRAALNVNQPVSVVMHPGTRNQKMRQAALQKLEDIGMTALYSHESEIKAAEDAIPDSVVVDADSLPPFIKYYRCGEQIESGEPFCGDFKYNETFCSKRRFKAGWHPGW